METERKEDKSSSGSDSKSGRILVHTESMLEKNDKEYHPTTMDSKERKTNIKNKFQLTKQEMKIMTQKKDIKENEINKRQKRSMSMTNK